MPVELTDFLQIHHVHEQILSNLSIKNKLRLAFTNKDYSKLVLDYLNKLNIISVPHCYVAHAHEARPQSKRKELCHLDLAITVCVELLPEPRL